MNKQLSIILIFVVILAKSSFAQFEVDSIFTWKHILSTDLTTQANIRFIARAGLVVTSWNFSDGSSSIESSPNMLFPYSSSTDFVVATLNYTENSETKTISRTIPLSPASFWVQNDVNLQNLADNRRIFKSVFCLENTIESIGTLRFAWSIDGVELNGHYFSNSALGQWPNIYHTFSEGGEHTVQLSVYDINAQSNVATYSQLVVLPELSVSQDLKNIPNVFTPNNDGVNDFFEVASSGTSWFVIRIFSRTGALLYEGESSIIQWDGKNNQGRLLPDGCYYYIIEDTRKVYKPANGFVYIFGE